MHSDQRCGETADRQLTVGEMPARDPRLPRSYGTEMGPPTEEHRPRIPAPARRSAQPSLSLTPTEVGAQCAKISLRKRVIATLYSSSARTSEGFCGCVK